MFLMCINSASAQCTVKALSKLIIDSSIIVVVYLYVVWQLLTTLNFL